MKVSSRRGSGVPRAIVASVVIAAAVIAGTGIVPSRPASAAVATSDADASQVHELAPIGELQKTDEIRQPSGLDAAEAGAPTHRTPTRIRAKAVHARTSGSIAVAASSAPLADGWQRARVSWYGPGFIGNTMAGGGTLEWGSMVVAHRSLPFGTRIEFAYNGNTCVAVVQDRGPFVGGRTFDLGPGTAAALGFSGVGTVDYRILR